MNDESRPRKPWLNRFSKRGGINICLTLAVAPFIYHLFHHSWGFDSFYTILLGSLVSIVVAHIVLLPLVLLFVGIFLSATHRAICPGCEERALIIGIRISERTPDPELHRVYQLAHCKRCQRHYRRLGDGTFHELPGNA